MPKVGALGPTAFDAEAAERKILETVLDPTKAPEFTAEEWRSLEDTAQRVVERQREEQFQGRISQLVAERAAGKAAAPSYPEQLVNRFMRGATGTATSAIRGASLLHPEAEADLRAKGVLQTPEESEGFLRRTLPVDPTDESFLSKGVEAAGSAAPFVLASAASGGAGLPSWLAPALLGASTNAGQTYDEAILAGEDPEAAKRAAIVGALIGLTEAAGVGRLGGKAPGLTSAARRGVTGLVTGAGKEFGEEAFQEAVNQTLNNVNAKILSGYDPKRAITEGVGEAGWLGGFVGGTFGGGLGLAGAGAARVGRLREMAAERAAGAEAVRSEPSAPLDLTPTTIGPTELISLREAAAKPEFRKRLEEATKPPAEVAPPAEAVAAPAQAAPVENLTDLLGAAGQSMADNLRQALRDSVETSGKLPTAERGSLLGQVFEAAVARGAPRDVDTLDKAVQLAGQGLEGAKAQFNQVFPAGGAAAPAATQPVADPADPLASAKEIAKSLRKPTEAEAKQAAEEAKRQAKQVGKEFEKQAKKAEKEAGKEAKLDDQARREAEGEIRRMSLYDEAALTAQSAGEEAESLIEAEDFSGAIGKLRARQNALQQSVKYLPETPEAVKTKANVAEIIEGINARIPDLRKQALAARQGTAKPEAEPAPAKAAEPAAKRRADTGRRMAAKYREQAKAAASQGRLLEAQAAHKAELQLLSDVMRITPPADVGARAQIRNAITAVENDLRGISGELRKGRAQRPKAVDQDAPTAELPLAPLLSQVNNPEGGVPPRTESLSGVFGRLVRQQEAEREAAPQSRRKDTGVLSPAEYLKRKTGGEGIRVSDRGEASLLGSKEAGIVGLTNRGSKWTLSDAQVLLDEGGFALDDGRRFTDESVTENDVLNFLGAYGKEGRLDTEGLDRRLAEEEAEFYANLPSEPLEADPRIVETAPLSERLTEPESAASRPVEETTAARRPTERRFAPKATAENIEELRDRRDVLSRLRHDRPGELTQDLNDEFRELGSRIAEFDAEQAKAARGGRPDLAPPPGGDERPLARPSREDMRRVFAAAEARLEAEAARAAEVLPKSDTEMLERGRAAVDALFADVEQDVDALDLLDRAIEGDEDARQDLIEFADRSHGVDAETVGSIIDARRAGREQERGRVRKIAQARRGQNPDEAGAAGHGENGPTVETVPPPAREVSSQEIDLLSGNPADLSVDDLRQYRLDLDKLKADGIRGLVELPAWAERQLDAKIKQTSQVWDERRKKGEIEPKNARPSQAVKPFGKVEGGRRLVEQAKERGRGEEGEREKGKETPTVVHPNPEIDRKPILAETNRGTVLVPNPNNKTGVSEVKDRSDSPAEHKFSSTQVNLPAEIADRIIAFGRRVPDADLAEDGREDKPHITVKYGLHGWDAKFAEQALAGEKPARVTFGKVSLFETNPDFDVIKVEVKSDDLHRLNKKVSESQPVTDTHPTYRPHATIAYVKKGKGARYVGNDFLEGKTVTLSSVTFSGRDGERVEIPLGAKAETGPAKAEQSQALARAVGSSPSDESKVKVSDLGLESKTAPARSADAVATQRTIPIDDITLGRDDLSRGRMNQVQTALAGGVKPEKRGVKLAEQVDAIEVVPDPERQGKWIVENDGNHRVALLKLQGFKGDVPVTAWEAQPAQPRSAGGGTYLGFGLGSLQPLMERSASVLARRTKVPIPEDFDVNKYIDGVVEALGEAQKRGVSPKVAAELPSELEKLVTAVGDNDGWAVVDAHKRIAKIIGSRGKSDEIEKIDASVWAKLSALRKAGMLAGVPTHLRNIFGNTLFQQMEEVSRMPAAMMDAFLALAFTKRRTVAGASITASGRAIGKALTTGMKEAGQVLKKGLTDAEAKEQQLQEVRFRNPVLDAYTKYVFRSLSASDAVFYRGAYDRALSERAKLKAINEAREGLIKRDQVKAREKEIRENPDLDIDLAAKEDARIAVFRNNNLFTDKITGPVRSGVGPGGNLAIDTVLPFDRTPSNIVIRALEYTPAGYGRNVIQLARAAMNREFTPEQQRAFSRVFGRATTGTFGVMLLGYILAAKGLMTGFYDEEDKQREALRRAAGRYPASIRLGDRWYSVEGLAPVGALLALGATVHREWNEDVKDEEDRPLRTLRAVTEGVLFDVPLMGATKEVYKGATQPGSLGQRLGRIAGSFIPRPIPEIGTLADDSQRDTVSSLRGFRKIGSEFGNEIRARLPVARTSLPPKVDVFGEPVRTEKSDVIDPFSSRLAEESVRGLRDLLDLDLGLSKPQREKGESGEEYNERVRERGRDYKSALSDLTDDEDVRGMSREARRAVYEKSLDPQAMERAGKLSSGSVRVERQIEGLRAEAYAVLGSMSEYRALKAQDQKAVRDLISKELERFKAEAAHAVKGKYGGRRLTREKRARVPDWTPAELARAALEARE
jgi:2'-5' RNA ligase